MEHQADQFTLMRLGFPINMYDVRKSCDRSPEKDGPLCYKEAEWMPVWLNNVDVKKELGANPAINFTSLSQKVNKDFLSSGDLMHYSAGLLTDLVDDGIRLLVYAGDTGKSSDIPGVSIHWFTLL
jgi:cathepsin A (carboxypeptidase C)